MSELKKITKCYLSFRKELDWLEEMALKGYMLKDIKFGIRYYFQKEQPRHMLYEIDRFDLKKNPTSEEMLQKKQFIEMATEAGWREVTHDESMNYYFTKEYEENGFNELYNDEESIQIRADKYRKRFMDDAKAMVKWIAVVSVASLVFWFLSYTDYFGDNDRAKMISLAYQFFVAIYLTFTSAYALAGFKVSEFMYKDMKTMYEDKQQKKKQHKEWKLLLTTKGLEKYLKKHAEKNEKLVSMGSLTYVFEKVEQTPKAFVFDSKAMVDSRRKKMGQKKLTDKKDWCALGNDWQAESLAYAEENGLECLCALNNRAIIYQVYNEKMIPEDMKKQSTRFFAILGGAGMLAAIGGVIGFFVGFFSTMWAF